jgi:spore maturation protein SpmA
MIKYIFIILFIPSIVFAEIENARDLMEAGKFKEAMEELMPAARSGMQMLKNLLELCTLWVLELNKMMLEPLSGILDLL